MFYSKEKLTELQRKLNLALSDLANADSPQDVLNASENSEAYGNFITYATEMFYPTDFVISPIMDSTILRTLMSVASKVTGEQKYDDKGRKTDPQVEHLIDMAAEIRHLRGKVEYYQKLLTEQNKMKDT